MTSSPRVRSLAFLRAAEVWAVLRMWVVYLCLGGLRGPTQADATKPQPTPKQPKRTPK